MNGDISTLDILRVAALAPAAAAAAAPAPGRPAGIEFGSIHEKPKRTHGLPEKEFGGCVAAYCEDQTHSARRALGRDDCTFADGSGGIGHADPDKINESYSLVRQHMDPGKIARQAPSVFQRPGPDSRVLVSDPHGAGSLGFGGTAGLMAPKKLGRFKAGVITSTNFGRPGRGAVTCRTPDGLKTAVAHWQLALKPD